MKKILLISHLLLSTLAYTQTGESVFVYFAVDKHELTVKGRSTLDSLTDHLDTSDRIELHGHCDARGSDAYNVRLSQQRVKTVEQYLLDIGWTNKDIAIAQAHGERNPVKENDSETGRSLNRRVEIRVLRGKAAVSLKEKFGDSTLTTGANIVLRNINYQGGLPYFLPSSDPMLTELLDAMIAYPNLVIRVEGHICCQPERNDGLDNSTGFHNLSESRAKAVKDYLVQNGIAENRVQYIGFGHSQPLYPYPEQSEAERIENRRVEIKILKK